MDSTCYITVERKFIGLIIKPLFGIVSRMPLVDNIEFLSSG